MSPRYQKEFVMFGFLIHFAISNDLDGWDCGLISCKKVSNGKQSALRIVAWMGALWIGKLNQN